MTFVSCKPSYSVPPPLLVLYVKNFFLICLGTVSDFGITCRQPSMGQAVVNLLLVLKTLLLPFGWLCGLTVQPALPLWLLLALARGCG